MTAKMGNDKVNGARGADDTRRTKPEGAGEKKGPEKSPAIIDWNLPGRVLCQKLHSRPGVGAILQKRREEKISQK